MKENKKIILGVCAWLSPKLGIEDTILRVLFVLGVMLAGTGIGVYFILWIVKVLEERN